MIDAIAARRFIGALTGDPNARVSWQSFTDSAPHPKPDPLARTLHGTFDEHRLALERLNAAGAGIFVCINETDLLGITRDHVVAVRALFFDDDATHPTAPEIHLPLSIIVQSSPGERNRHGYWLTVPGSISVADFQPAQKRLIELCHTDKSVHNPNRVMRLPGSLHMKNPAAPFRVRIPKVDRTLVYTPTQIFESFPVTATTLENAPDPKARKTPVPGADAATDDEGTPILATPDFPAVKRNADKVREWLLARGVLFTQPDGMTFKLITCPLNPQHKDARIVIMPTGAIVGMCFHSSCGGNAQIWPLYKFKIGGWQGPGVISFARGDEAELARHLGADLRLGSDENLVHSDGKIWRYNGVTGIWEAISDAELSRQGQLYAGVATGKNGTGLKLKRSAVVAAGKFLADSVDQPRFFVDAPTGVGFANGFAQLVENKIVLQPHAAGNRAAFSLPFAYDPGARAPRFMRYLDEVFEGETDIEERKNLIAEFAGACLFGIATRFGTALLLSGEGWNGKSVLIKVLMALFPPAARAAVSPQDFSDRFRLAHLAGVRLNAVSEMPEADILDSTRFKAVVTGDPITAEVKYGNPFSLVSIAGHLFAANRLPGTTDQSIGFWRRFLVLTFNRFFPPETWDDLLDKTIIATELAGVAAWIVAGAARVAERHRFIVPPSSEAAKAAWRIEVDPVMAWVTACCAPVAEPLTGTVSDELYKQFIEWTDQNGHKHLSATSFGRRLKQIGVASAKPHATYYALRITTTLVSKYALSN